MLKTDTKCVDCEKIMYLETKRKNTKNFWIGTILFIIVAFNLILAAFVYTLQRDLRYLRYEVDVLHEILQPYASAVAPQITQNYHEYVPSDYENDNDIVGTPNLPKLDRKKRDIIQIRDDGVPILDEPYKSNKYRPKTTTVATLKFYNSLRNVPLRNHTHHGSGLHYPKHNHNHKFGIKSRPKRKLSARMTANRELVEEFNPENHNKRSGNSSRHKQFITNAHFYGNAANMIDNCNTVWTLGNWAKSHNDYLQQNDGLVIKNTGIYFIYAQLYYYHPKNLSGFSVLRNQVSNLMTCAVSLHGTKQMDNRTNSCYVATVAHLNAGDILQIQDHHTAKCIFQDDKTYFGIFKLSDIKSE
ncbi:protein eiger [Chrysoperla carnea]|uniref:protein eiger n=1 Tax=Chrysoperla carnea TaxID=189513 RepID=UPI001D05F9FC|nr:protein eiger [Chrysoperla carnea]